MSQYTVLVTGSAGFIGRHVMEALSRRPNTKPIGFDLGTADAVLQEGLLAADAVIHLAGVNRPTDPAEFKTGNANFTSQLCERISAVRAGATLPVFVLASSIQAALDNPYGISKREAEDAVRAWSAQSGGRSVVFRLKNVFGKWCRPHYNSVTATFCHQIARDLPITISDPQRQLDLVYIDDVVRALMAVLDNPPMGCEFREVPVAYQITLGDLADRIRSFRESRRSLVMPSLGDDLTRSLYATYLSYLEGADFAYGLQQRTDTRGTLAEFIKSSSFGQIFVSRTYPGITRGNHYHHTKVEKFLVVEGDAVVRFRRIPAASSCPGHEETPPGEVIEHRVSGREFKVVDIPPGYTHSIENVGTGELVTLFWASEIFDPTRPDTIGLPVY